MKLLYKYYSNESTYAFKNLENGNICFSALESLNDPFEGIGKYLCGVSSEDQSYWENLIGYDLPKQVSKEFSEELRDLFNFKYRVFCSSKDYDNCLLWAYYANSHKGFCVGYEEDNISELSDELFDVEYNSDMCLINEFDESTYKKLLAVKSVDWRHEKERRALYALKDIDVLSLKFEEDFDEKNKNKDKIYKSCIDSQTNNIKYLCADKFILKKCEPSVIYLGLRMEQDDKQRLINFARKSNIKVYQMLQKENSFKFIAREVREVDNSKFVC